MTFVAIFLTGIGLSMDAFAVAIAKGMTLKKNLLKNAIKIGAFFGIFQALMPLIGWFFGKYFSGYIGSFANYIAFILLTIIGGKMVYESIKEIRGDKNLNEEEIKEASIDLEENEDLKSKDLIILAIATSIDALAVGVGFAFLNVRIVPSIIIIGITTFVLCVIATLIGKKIGGILQKYAEIIGGVILIIIGIKMLF